MRLLVLICIAVGLGGLFWHDEVSQSYWVNHRSGSNSIQVASLGGIQSLPGSQSIQQSSIGSNSEILNAVRPRRNSVQAVDIKILKARPHDFRHMVSRPLFNQTRRPTPLPKPVVTKKPRVSPPRPPTLPFVLVGTVAADRGSTIALLRETKRKRVIRAKIGDTISSWKVLAISASRIEFQHKHWTRELLLYR